MATDSSVAGYLAPVSSAIYDDALDDTFQALIAALTGVSGDLVRPRWVVEPSNRPDFATNWVAFGCSKGEVDTFAYDRHDPTNPGSTSVERDEILSVFCSFYGPNAHGLCERMRDGLEVSQNRDVLSAVGIALVEVQEAAVLPSLLKEKWIRRVDVTVMFRRRTGRKFAILHFTAAGALTITHAEKPGATGPIANFTAFSTSVQLGTPVSFVDLSQGSPTAWAWYFMNDGVVGSNAQNPTFTYPNLGTYTVKLVASNANGLDYKVKTGYITVTVVGAPVPPPSVVVPQVPLVQPTLVPFVEFRINPTVAIAGAPVQFTDLTINNPTAWDWEFNNDGVVGSVARNPTYTYASAGIYSVRLTAKNAYGQATKVKIGFVVVAPFVPPPVTSFTTSPGAPVVGAVVTYTDTSTGNPTVWAWIFGDGATSTLQNPTHSYSAVGSYTVTLVASNTAGSGGLASQVIVVASASVSSLVDFEALGLAATSAGTPVGTTYLASFGLTFSANATAYHKGVDANDDPLGAFLKPPNSFGYARTFFSGSGFTSFSITVTGRQYKKFSLLIAASVLPVEIYAYDAFNNVLNSGLHAFSNAGGMAWTPTPYVLVDGSAATDIARITFNLATRGSFAIDDLLFQT